MGAPYVILYSLLVLFRWHGRYARRSKPIWSFTATRGRCRKRWRLKITRPPGSRENRQNFLIPVDNGERGVAAGCAGGFHRLCRNAFSLPAGRAPCQSVHGRHDDSDHFGRHSHVSRTEAVQPFEFALGPRLVYIAYGLPFSVFVLSGFFKTIPREMEEAGLVDGCSLNWIFWRIMLHMARPASLRSAISILLRSE